VSIFLIAKKTIKDFKIQKNSKKIQVLKFKNLKDPKTIKNSKKI